jgi:hypothetical protein
MRRRTSTPPLPRPQTQNPLDSATRIAKRALARVVELADDPQHHISMELAPGDIQFINNYHVLHGRTAYRDDRAAGSVRHLKRLWLETRVLARRPDHFKNTMTDWSRNRSASRMTVN